ncbi:hypothetical protein LIER_15588 [Lithospermum erythrorhizon]|uniref:CCHC-type domain-containing protein n=1 Tax=Lithospermum erythrorhizon TaxID=34254 RepID=A0AAV3Q6P2_LITER
MTTIRMEHLTSSTLLLPINGALLLLAYWRANICLQDFTINHADLWIQIHNIPLENFDNVNILNMASHAGDVLIADWLSDEARAWKFVRVRIRIPVSAPLVHRTFIETVKGRPHWVAFRYEKVFRVCYRCGRIGHSILQCWINVQVALNNFLDRLQDNATEPNLEFYDDYDSPLFDYTIRAYPDTEDFRNTTLTFQTGTNPQMTGDEDYYNSLEYNSGGDSNDHSDGPGENAILDDPETTHQLITLPPNNNQQFQIFPQLPQLPLNQTELNLEKQAPMRIKTEVSTPPLPESPPTTILAGFVTSKTNARVCIYGVVAFDSLQWNQEVEDKARDFVLLDDENVHDTHFLIYGPCTNMNDFPKGIATILNSSTTNVPNLNYPSDHIDPDEDTLDEDQI